MNPPSNQRLLSWLLQSVQDNLIISDHNSESISREDCHVIPPNNSTAICQSDVDIEDSMEEASQLRRKGKRVLCDVDIENLPEEEIDEDTNDYNDLSPDILAQDVEHEEIEGDEEYRSVASSDSEILLYEDFEAVTQDLFEEEDSWEQPLYVLDVADPVQGMEWPTIKHCRIYLKDLAIKNNFEYKLVKNDGDRIRATCLGDGCEWLFYAYSSRSKNKDKLTMRLNKLNALHGENCMSTMDFMNKHADSDWVCEKLTEMMKTHYKIFKPQNMRTECWKNYGVKISYYVAWYAREKIMERINGNYERSYLLGPSCCDQVLLKNPGSIAICGNNAEDGLFKGMLICFKVSIQGWVAGCRPILGLDGCHLRGKYGGVCLSIVSLDSNNGLYPIAIYLTGKEIYANWFDFLEVLKPHLELHTEKLTFMSDAQKGLDQVINVLFPDANHRLCLRHMYKNFKKDMKAGNALEGYAWGAARPYRKSSCKHFLDNLKNAKEVAHVWLEQRGFEHFCRSEFDLTSVCEHITNNWSESFNNFINELQDKTVTDFVEHYCLLLMTHYRKRLNKAKSLKQDDVVPRVQRTIDENKKKYNDYIMRQSSDNVFNVEGANGCRWDVNLVARTCDCRQWQLSGIPCKHATSVMVQRRLNPSRFCHESLTVAAYLRSYQFSIFAIPNDFEWDEPTYIVQPPPLERPTGRPKGKRRRGEDEPSTSGKKNSRRCSVCRSTMHTKATCKGLYAAEIKERGRGNKGHGKERTTTKASDTHRGTVEAGRGRRRGRGRRGAGMGRGVERVRDDERLDNEPRAFDYPSFVAFDAAFGSQVDN